MHLRERLEARIGQVTKAKGEALDFLSPDDSSFFHRKTAEVVFPILEDGEVISLLGFNALCQKTIDSLLPLVDFITQTRSIAEFQELKELLLRLLFQYHPENLSRPKVTEKGLVFSIPTGDEWRIASVVYWLDWLLPELKIFPNSALLDDLIEGQTGFTEAWESSETLGSKPRLGLKAKIASLEQMPGILERIPYQGEIRVGLTIGKWRLGVHPEHISLLQSSKEALGRDGVLMVGVESQRSVWQRRGRDHFVLPDQTRLEQIAALEPVDYAVLLDPSEDQCRDLNRYYYQAWQQLNPGYYFFGSADYHWREEFERRGRELGVILLWERPTDSISTSTIIEQIRAIPS